MPIGGSLFLIAVGAVLKWAVTDTVRNVDLGAIGVILMIVGGIGLLFSIYWMTARRRTDVVYRGAPGTVGQATYVAPVDPVDRPY